MAEMTVTDALAELTLLGKRIESARSGLEGNTLITVVEVGKTPVGYRNRDEYNTKARAAVQKVDALITRRRTIKRAVVLSNAVTMVSVAGEEMTVAEAIEMKNFIAYYESVLNTMESAYTSARKDFDVAQARVKERLVDTPQPKGVGILPSTTRLALTGLHQPK
ncbi:MULTISPECIES: hypothetical protein [Oscillatoriales]|uniref:hypothetical protein n=1 Tax=Oscillatoriales TaxID=1150 RepID=UPI00029201FB|nr:hypothetical protein APPUASWS_027165 [Arthrospira platensis str. Paraca]MDT9311253.1 hypothetical protein [Limnospira sp. Paracas R14]